MTPVEDLLAAIRDPKSVRRDVAVAYAKVILARQECNWSVINTAILKRWKPHGLLWIKECAWDVIGG